MLAATYHRYGPSSVLTVATVPDPVPGPGDLLIRVRASTVSSGDVRVRSMILPSRVFVLPVRLVFGLRGPRNPVPGVELSGVVEAVGEGESEAAGFRVGDAVVASTNMRAGANAQFVVVRASGTVVHKPDRLSFEEAACLPFGGLTARYFLRKGGLRAGQRVLINGASGSLGTHSIQIARHAGAFVTGVCSGRNRALVESLGAHETVDYTQTPLASLRGIEPYDILFDTVGKADLGSTRHLLRPDGRFLAAVVTPREMRQAVTARLTGGPRLLSGVTTETREDLQALADLAEACHLRPPIDRVYPLSEIAAAHAHAESGRKVGHVVVSMPG
jgi:NADPH:quinone reductase-like Zn-dependent oxidoreductase